MGQKTEINSKAQSTPFKPTAPGIKLKAHLSNPLPLARLHLLRTHTLPQQYQHLVTNGGHKSVGDILLLNYDINYGLPGHMHLARGAPRGPGKCR